MIDKNETIVDFLVIGGGIAGLRAAIELAYQGTVVVLTKDTMRESSTEYAQGGIAVAISDEDEVRIHYDDTLKAGDGLCNEKAVKVMVEEGPELIHELISWGAEFDKTEDTYAFTYEAAHSKKRILRAKGDSTGKEIERALTEKAKSLHNLFRYSFSFTLDLIVEDGRCIGALVLKGNRIITILAKAVVLATGGAGQIYSHNTNPLIATGDGIAIAYRAGAIIESMEFIQFHPTSLYFPSAPQFLLSEAMRGEGGILINNKGERFAFTYHKEGELAPRDIVSRAIVAEMVKTGTKHVNLDMRHLDRDFIKKRFPRIYTTCLQYDVDITEDLIPVCPAAHYVMGGVKTDCDGKTSIEGLYAAGEVACTGVHGANRLASNSLLEGLVFGARAGRACIEYVHNHTTIPANFKIPEIRRVIVREDTEKIRHSLKRIMWEKAGIIRCKESLIRAKEQIEKWSYLLRGVEIVRRQLELMNMITVSMLTTESALLREGSIGAHYRSDFKKRSDAKPTNLKKNVNWLKGQYWPERV
jgi:L-aspartate oxidase